MILLVPIAPEAPRRQVSQIWPGLVLVLILSIGYLESLTYVKADMKFVEDLYSVGAETEVEGEPVLTEKAYQYLRLRPLLKISPAPADWDLQRVIFANFIHGGQVHLALNLIGAFAGARICSTFLPFLCTLSIFILGGCFGFIGSLLLSDAEELVPHVGASAGIFALMGAYYVYNFRFRTRYFFWFPARRSNTIALRTSWFFFLDVVLLEVLLSAAQWLPHSTDGVDHLAHVFGFIAGLILALGLRVVMRWPSFLQTRGEFVLWKNPAKGLVYHPLLTPFERWMAILEVNPYNDRLKEKLLRLLYNQGHVLNSGQIDRVLRLITPTYVRLHPDEASVFIREILSKGIELPESWLKRMPYDSIILLAKKLSSPPEEQYLLIKLVKAYQLANQKRPDTGKRIEMLLSKLSASQRS